jgi:hypothetical protein
MNELIRFFDRYVLVETLLGFGSNQDKIHSRSLSGFSTAGSKFLSIVRRARMVSARDNRIILVRASEE